MLVQPFPHIFVIYPHSMCSMANTNYCKYGNCEQHYYQYGRILVDLPYYIDNFIDHNGQDNDRLATMVRTMTDWPQWSGQWQIGHNGQDNDRLATMVRTMAD